jgi:hypothetical protein
MGVALGILHISQEVVDTFCRYWRGPFIQGFRAISNLEVTDVKIDNNQLAIIHSIFIGPFIDLERV